MKEFFKWYFEAWNDKNMSDFDYIIMSWASFFIILGLAGVFILGCLIYNSL